MESKHPWKARLGVGITMLLLAFLGMVIVDITKGGGWDYWKWIVPVYAILALWLSWYIRRNATTVSPITLIHEIFHWLGLIAAVFLVSFFADLGIISRFIAGLFDLTLLSLAIFLAGIYIESTFLFIGLFLGALATVSAVVVQYLYAILIPLTLGILIIIGISLSVSHKRSKNPEA